MMVYYHVAADTGRCCFCRSFCSSIVAFTAAVALLLAMGNLFYP